LELERLEQRLLLSSAGTAGQDLALKGSVIEWSGDIPDGTVWSGGDVHRVVGDVRVPQGATLTIQPGAIVQFNSGIAADLLVEGTLDADGTAASAILFTSVRDDTGLDGELGTADDIDTNGDGPSEGQKGDWARIGFAATSTGSVLDYVEVRYGGGSWSAGQVYVSGGELTMTNSVLRDSWTAGLRIEGGDPTLTDNTFQGNTGAAISMDLASNPTIGGVTLDDNGVNGVELDGGTLPGDGFWNDPEIVYRLAGDVTVPDGTTLTVAPGQIVKGAHRRWRPDAD